MGNQLTLTLIAAGSKFPPDEWPPRREAYTSRRCGVFPMDSVYFTLQPAKKVAFDLAIHSLNKKWMMFDGLAADSLFGVHEQTGTYPREHQQEISQILKLFGSLPIRPHL